VRGEPGYVGYIMANPGEAGHGLHVTPIAMATNDGFDHHRYLSREGWAMYDERRQLSWASAGFESFAEAHLQGA
jgi:hypothetical protein